MPLWDHQPLLDTFGQMQEIRTYYDFASVDNDRYRIDGEWRQVMLSARELNSGSLPSRTWINERMTFTHGYGLTLGPVNQVTPEGLPVLFIKNLPPESSVPSLQVTEPSLYFGELSNDHVFVKTRTKEFHYPKGDDNVTSVYDGTGRGERGQLLAQGALLHPLRVDEDAALRRLHPRKPRDLPPPHRGAGGADRTLPDLRPRSVPGHLRGAAPLGPGRLHHQPAPIRTRRPSAGA